MINHTAFLDYVLPHAPGCTDQMALLEIKNTIIDFCEKSYILQTDLDQITTIPTVSDYDFEPPNERLVVRIMKLWFKGVELDPRSVDEINTPSAFNTSSGALVERSDPTFYYQKDARTFSIYPIPNVKDALSLTLRVVLKPTRSAQTIDNLIYEEYAEIIGHGAISRLALSPGKPYSSVQMAAARNSLYTAGLNVARQRAQDGYVRVSKQVMMRRI
jgi:hypothetical protein